MAAYTRRLRCAGAPRRPASGSGLSLTIPAWHAVLYDPEEFEHRHGPVLRCRHGLRRDLSGSALPKFPQSASRGARLSRLPGSRGLLLRTSDANHDRRCKLSNRYRHLACFGYPFVAYSGQRTKNESVQRPTWSRVMPTSPTTTGRNLTELLSRLSHLRDPGDTGAFGSSD